jgi:hypothetical protein
LLALDATEWEGVYDRSTDLIWGRSLLAGTHTYADAIKAAAAATLCGKPARLGTIRERLSIVDYDHSEPALDPNYFDTAQKNGWEWTATPYKPSPSGYAWFVFLGGGHSNWILQGSRLSVRAVRASQSFDLSKRDAKAVA